MRILEIKDRLYTGARSYLQRLVRAVICNASESRSDSGHYLPLLLGHCFDKMLHGAIEEEANHRPGHREI